MMRRTPSNSTVSGCRAASAVAIVPSAGQGTAIPNGAAVQKILVVGLWKWVQYEAAISGGFRSNGVEVHELSVAPFFRGRAGVLQEALPFPSPAAYRINRTVLDAVSNLRPDIAFFWRPTHLAPRTLRNIRALGTRTASFNNDDPFGPAVHGHAPWHHHLLWRRYIQCLPHFDFNFFYRRVNCTEAVNLGARHAELLLPYFLPEQDRPVALTDEERRRFGADVVFVGHHEADGREHAIRALVEGGVDVKLWGDDSWSPAVLGDLYPRFGPVRRALGPDYARALAGAKVCLCFLSKLNRDTYTRRCFEIPACGRVLLAERTDDLRLLFREDEEACFFSSHEELVQKARWLLANDDVRERIAQAGLRRVWADGHAVNERVKQLLAAFRGAAHRKD